jgi:hypothetical protein
MNRPTVDPARLEANWRAITAELDTPRPGVVERALRRCGVPAATTRVIVATPALRRAWFLAIGVAVLVGLGAAEPGDRASLFAMLVLAPTVPVLGVALAFGPSSDPMYEAQLAAPMRGVRLVAIRATTVLVVSITVIGGLTALAPDTRPMAAAWLLPALALTAASIALMSVSTPRRAASVVASVWFAIVVVAQAVSSGTLPAFGVVGQVTALVVAAIAVAAVVARRDHYDVLEYVS